MSSPSKNHKGDEYKGRGKGRVKDEEPPKLSRSLTPTLGKPAPPRERSPDKPKGGRPMPKTEPTTFQKSRRELKPPEKQPSGSREMRSAPHATSDEGYELAERPRGEPSSAQQVPRRRPELDILSVEGNPADSSTSTDSKEVTFTKRPVTQSEGAPLTAENIAALEAAGQLTQDNLRKVPANRLPARSGTQRAAKDKPVSKPAVSKQPERTPHMSQRGQTKRTSMPTGLDGFKQFGGSDEHRAEIEKLLDDERQDVLKHLSAKIKDLERVIKVDNAAIGRAPVPQIKDDMQTALTSTERSSVIWKKIGGKLRTACDKDSWF
ncbi:hypothetical protein BCR34DRAFT_600568 [Clohesyomyces aquaticus]|uniref:Uncharacterized protein n=1 Tax=Clohesyomyces aquaticus TaxID=1231657 RepID=A0A1Y1ZQK7_9PLEO|nr:hypothetical protein BCR34DRAFT_600568 [Clohesyomyces aquaticus]